MSSANIKLQQFLSFNIAHSLVYHMNSRASHTVINLNKDIPFFLLVLAKSGGILFSFLFFIVTLRNVQDKWSRRESRATDLLSDKTPESS